MNYQYTGTVDGPRMKRVMALQRSLTPREGEVLRLYLAGLSTEALALEIGISVRAVRTHLSRVRGKYEAAGFVLKHVLKRAPMFCNHANDQEGAV